ncbi:hypothetical protein ALQ24_200022 [Pseudomonas syringae pv. antirrhini]|nr:hypothetical protein ALQ24_200022 [Pseudomonas syringae pv. antirrhini]
MGEGFRLCHPCQAIDPAAAVPDLKGKDSGYGDRAGGHRSSCSSARPKGGRIPAMATVPVAIDPAAAVPDLKGEGFRLCPPCQAIDPAAAVPDPKGEGFRLSEQLTK